VLGLCLCNFFEQSFGGLVCWLAAIPLLSHFCSCSSVHAAAGFAIDRPEGDSIKKKVLAHRFPEALAVFGHGSTKKIISYA